MVKKTQLMGCLLAIFTLIGLTTPMFGGNMNVTFVSAYGTDNYQWMDAHDLIMIEAIEVLRADGHGNVADLMEQYLGRMEYASYMADQNGDNVNHYHSPGFHGGLLWWPLSWSAAALCDAMFDDAVTFYNAGNWWNAFYKLGYALHLLADMSVPHHSVLVVSGTHQDYEDYVFDHKNSLITNVDRNGYYTIPSTVSGHYSASNPTPFGYADYAAHMSYARWSWVNNFNDKTRDPYGYADAAEYLLPMAVKLTAGLMHLFYYS